MNQAQWDKMNNQEKFEYLNACNPEVRTQTVMNGKARSGDPDAFKTVYSIVRGGVETAEAYSLDDANTQDKESVKYWKSSEA